jgi:hypothetical protein
MTNFVDVHPRWCSPRECKAAGMEREHRSEPRGFDARRVSTDHGPLSTSGTGIAWLSKAAAAWETETFLRIDADSMHLHAPLGQAVGILAQITDLVEAGAQG